MQLPVLKEFATSIVREVQKGHPEDGRRRSSKYW